MSTPSSTSPPSAVPLQSSAFLERLIRFLLPYFVDVCPDPASARAEIVETLASYGARTRAELLNAAQIIAYGLSALDVLHEAKTTEMSPSLRLRSRGCANNLNRSGQQNEQTLARRLTCDEQAHPPAELIDDMSEAALHQQILQVHAELAAAGIHLPPPPSPPAPRRMSAATPGQNQPPRSSAMIQALSAATAPAPVP